MLQRRVMGLIEILIATLVATLFSAALFTIGSKWAGLPKRLTDSQNVPYLIVAFALPVAVLLAARRGPCKSRYGSLLPLIFLFASALFLPFVFIYDTLGTYRLDTIIYSLQESTFAQLSEVGFGEFNNEIADFLLVSVTLLVGAIVLHRWLPHFDKLLLAISAVFVLQSPVLSYTYNRIFPKPYHALINLDVDFKAPAIVLRPERKPNIVMIYMESMERTFRNLEPTKDAFGRLARLEDSGMSFTNLDQIHGTGFSAGGLIATQCGIPLLPRGAISVRGNDADQVLSNILDAEGFKPGITCLGDILTTDGYKGSYMNGSELSMFSIRPFVESHGYIRLTGIETLGPDFGDPYENTWGLNDETLFRLAREEVATLAEAGDPFFLTILTVATHAGNGVLDPDCDYPVVAGSQIPAAIYCTGEHVENLMKELETQGIGDDTVVVLMSDHFIMRNTLSGVLGEVADKRRNFFAVLGTSMKGKNDTYGSMLDVYPTLLEVLGYQLEDRRANLGFSLLSDQKTLVGRLGVNDLSNAFAGNTLVSGFLWSAKADTPRLP